MKIPPRVDRALALAFLLVVYAAFLAAAFLVSTTRGKDGGHSLEGWAIATLGFAYCVRVILCRIKGWVVVGIVASVLIVSVMAQLGITDPLWLQHFHLTRSAGGWLWTLFLLVIAITTLRALIFAGGAWSGMDGMFIPLKTILPVGWLTKIRWYHWLFGVVLFVACAAHLTRYVDKPHFAGVSYLAQLGLTALFLALNAVLLFLVFAAVPLDAVRSLRVRFARLNWERVLPWVLAAWVFVISLLLGFFALDFVPHIPDELAYIFQAECFARGMLWGKAPPSPESFKVYLVTVEGDRWFAATPPGWPAVLAIGSAIGAPWIINPLLGALSIPLAHALTRRLLGKKSAHVVALLLAVSPWLLYLSASYMTHPLSLFLMLASWLCVAKARNPEDAERGSAVQASRRAALWSLLAGALLGWLALVRQLDAVLVAGISGLWMLGLFGKRMPWSAILAFGLGFIAIAALILPYNAAMTGSASQFPINAYLDKLWYPGANRLGFGEEVGNPTGGWGDLDAFPGHGLRDVLINTNQNLYATNFELFGWCIGSLFFAALHLFFGKKTQLDRLMIFSVAVLLLGYHLYWFSGGPDFGARYWYLMIYPLVFLTVRGIETCVEGLRKGSAGEGTPERMGVVVGVLILIALTVFIPWRAVGRYKDYRGFHDDYRRLDIERNALVFVKSARNSDYGSAFIRNSPDQSEPRPIFAEDIGDAANQKLIAAFPDRPVYFVAGRSTGGATRITEVRRPAR